MWPFKSKTYPKKDFSILRKLAQMGDIVLIHDERPNIIGDGIEWFTNGNVSHCEIYVGGGDGGTIGYTVGGCKRHTMDNWCKDYYKITIRRIKNITIDQAALIKEAAYQDLADNKSYDYLSYVGFIIMQIPRKIKGLFGKKSEEVAPDNPIQGSGKVCSTGIVEWCHNAKIRLFPKIGDESVTPQHLLTTEKANTIVEV